MDVDGWSTCDDYNNDCTNLYILEFLTKDNVGQLKITLLDPQLNVSDGVSSWSQKKLIGIQLFDRMKLTWDIAPGHALSPLKVPTIISLFIHSYWIATGW